MEIWFIIILTISIIVIFYCIIGLYRNNNIITQLHLNINNESYTNEYTYIPRNFFQLVKDKKNIHTSLKSTINKNKTLNPNWNYILYDDNDMVKYMKNNFKPNILHIYNKINPEYGPAKADFFRYLLMYNEGGVYFDIKSSMKYPLDNFLHKDDQFILSHWPCKAQKNYTHNKYGEFQQWYIITKPKHPYLKAVIEMVINNILNYDLNITGTGKLAVLKTTGPIAYTKAILPIMSNHKHRIFQSHEYIGLIYDNTNSLIIDHTTLFSQTHYSKLDSPVIFNN